MNPEVEMLKKMDPKKVELWDMIHDRRKVFRCNRCGAEWKCPYDANTFGTAHEYNGDPDILCQCCGFPTVKEMPLEPLCENCERFYNNPKCKYAERPDQYADECKAYKPLAE